MDAPPIVVLRPGEAERVIAGHPWIYEGSILRLTRPAEDGAAVHVQDHRRRPLGTGLFNSRSKIRVRLLSREPVEIDRAFFLARIRAALRVRQHHMPGATSFRVVNSESDSLSGLIVDKYEDVLALQISSLGMDRRRVDIVAALEEAFSPRAIFERSDAPTRRFEGLSESSGVLAGSLDGPLRARLNGLVFQTALPGGQKTGLYLDQQVNYDLVARWAAGGEVLDCFSFSGGFSLHAARAGATRAHGIDQSEEALAQARENAELNGLGDRCSFEAANVFDWLSEHSRGKASARYDLIILDPPPFTRNRAAVPGALRGYKEIHLRALKLLKPQGTLVTFCCSHHVDAVTFQQVVVAAAGDAGCTLRRTAIYGQGPDHPVLPAIPETEYLKGFAFELAGI